jgi:hypothetical protein
MPPVRGKMSLISMLPGHGVPPPGRSGHRARRPELRRRLTGWPANRPERVRSDLRRDHTKSSRHPADAPILQSRQSAGSRSSAACFRLPDLGGRGARTRRWQLKAGALCQPPLAVPHKKKRQSEVKPLSTYAAAFAPTVWEPNNATPTRGRVLRRSDRGRNADVSTGAIVSSGNGGRRSGARQHPRGRMRRWASAAAGRWFAPRLGPGAQGGAGPA